MIKFPKDFKWGVATSSYQIEGAASIDGRKDSVWDVFCRKKGAISDKSCAEKSVDHYHNWQEDVNLIKKLDIDRYRFSIAWPRILPDGIGDVNKKGIDFYDKLIDQLLTKGIEPWITLFHWDYPYTLFQKGGWLNPDSSDWFAEYVNTVAEKFSDRVKHWITLNEPQCFIHYGHQTGINAPGLRLNIPEVLQAAHNVLLSHGKAVKVIRKISDDAKIGLVQANTIAVPASENPADIDAARQASWSIKEKNTWSNSWWGDPVFSGRYPLDGRELMKKSMPTIKSGDMKIISQTIDFYGLNIYTAKKVKSNGDAWTIVKPEPGLPVTAMDWPVVPESIYWATKFIYERYEIPLVITENGMANNDWVHLDGKVHDSNRIDYLKRYLQKLNEAIEEGVPVDGYFQWSLMDNFEWAEGFSKRFGLVYIDYTTCKRIPKDSFYWYRDFIASQRKDEV